MNEQKEVGPNEAGGVTAQSEATEETQQASGPDLEQSGPEAQAQADEWQEKAEEYLLQWQRSTADMANMRRRHEQERVEYRKSATATLVADLLPVLDSFDRALEAIPPTASEQGWAEGVRLVERQLRQALERAGLQAIEAEGKLFDPTEHEALMNEDSAEPENTVIGELQRGYRLHDRVLRPAMVKVARGGQG